MISKKLMVKGLFLTLLAVIVILSQIILLKPHLNYGFSDVDWGQLSLYKQNQPMTYAKLLNIFKTQGNQGGVYTHQILYIGLQEEFFGLDFKSFQITTHIFKILATLFSFLIFFSISRNFLISIFSTIFFAFNYASVGTMFTVVTSSDYTAILSLGIFSYIYWKAIHNNGKNMALPIIAFFLLMLTLILSTERMYPLFGIILVVEIFLLLIKKVDLVSSFMRMAILLLPVLIIFLIKPFIFLDFLLHSGINQIILRLNQGDWNIILTPLISLGSILLPHDYAKYIGVINLDSLSSYLNSLFSGPLFIFFWITIIISILIAGRILTFTLRISLYMLFFISLIYILGSHFRSHILDKPSFAQAMIGGLILSFSTASFLEWLNNKKSEMLVGVFAGPFLSFIYILLTWIAASPGEVFAGTHRYLTTPAIGISLFLGSIIIIIFERLKKIFQNYNLFKIFSLLPFLLLIPYISINSFEIQSFFDYQLFHGFGASDKEYMRSQLNSYLTNLSSSKPSLFYFEWFEDHDRGYYYDGTILGGFKTWILWHKNINFQEALRPVDIYWNQPQKLKEARTVKDGIKGLTVYGKFFPDENFYAFNLKDKKVIDIKDKIIDELDR